jgi:hypothetical protein
MQKIIFRSPLRPNQISFSHGQDPKRTLPNGGHDHFQPGLKLTMRR